MLRLLDSSPLRRRTGAGRGESLLVFWKNLDNGWAARRGDVLVLHGVTGVFGVTVKKETNYV